jgi:hypothetical protein
LETLPGERLRLRKNISITSVGPLLRPLRLPLNQAQTLEERSLESLVGPLIWQEALQQGQRKSSKQLAHHSLMAAMLWLQGLLLVLLVLGVLQFAGQVLQYTAQVSWQMLR